MSDPFIVEILLLYYSWNPTTFVALTDSTVHIYGPLRTLSLMHTGRLQVHTYGPYPWCIQADFTFGAHLRTDAWQTTSAHFWCTFTDRCMADYKCTLTGLILDAYRQTLLLWLWRIYRLNLNFWNLFVCPYPWCIRFYAVKNIIPYKHISMQLPRRCGTLDLLISLVQCLLIMETIPWSWTDCWIVWFHFNFAQFLIWSRLGKGRE